MKTALSIAGSDSCGGAGIQADIKTMTMNGVYAMTAITALTAQNTTGVRAIQEATPAFLKEQLDAVFEDIFPNAVKIGMVSSSDLIRVIAERLRHYGAKNIVVDPVMVATSGSSLMKTDAVQTLIDELLPLSTVITPNIPEGEILSSEKIESRDDMERAAKRIGDTYGCAVLLKGGHRVIIGDLNSRRGRIEGMEPRNGVQVINAFVPLSEMFGYATDLRSKTQGRGNYSMEVSYYDEVPKNISDAIVAKTKGE